MKTFFKILSLLTLFIYSASAQNISGGSSFGTATTIPSFNVKHTMIKNSDNKYLKFYLKRGEGATVRLTAHVNDDSMSIYMYTPDNQDYNFTYDSYIQDGQTGEVSFTAQVTGYYYIEVRGDSGVADIEVYQSFYTPGVKDSDFSYQGTQHTSKYLTQGNHIKTALDNWYRFEAQQGDDITISLTAHVNSGSISMSLYAPYRDYAIGSKYYIYNNQTKTISFTAQTSGVFYIKVEGSEGNYDFNLQGVRPDLDSDNDGLSNSVEYVRGTEINNADTNNNGVSDYQESQNGMIGQFKTEWKRSDMQDVLSFSTAKSIPYYDAQFSFEKDENDKYVSFYLYQNQPVTISLKTYVNDNSMAMYVYEPNNLNTYNYIKSDTYIQNEEIGLIGFTAATTGVYYLKVKGDPGVADVAIYRGNTKDCKRDFHSTFNTAHYITEGNHLKETGLSDYYRFDAKIYDEITISLTAHVNYDNIDMYVYTPDDQDNYAESATYINDGETKTISFTAYIEGTYYLKVYDRYPGSYDLILSGIREHKENCTTMFSPAIIQYLLK